MGKISDCKRKEQLAQVTARAVVSTMDGVRKIAKEFDVDDDELFDAFIESCMLHHDLYKLLSPIEEFVKSMFEKNGGKDNGSDA